MPGGLGRRAGFVGPNENRARRRAHADLIDPIGFEDFLGGAAAGLDFRPAARGEGEGPGAAAPARPARRTRLALGEGPAARASVLGGQLAEEAREAAGAVSAGMRALGYAADSDEAALTLAGAEVFSSLGELPSLLGLA
ncbi:MAG TPA: hypothetical protein VIJ66_05360 [Solirubrobacteraceae bacterium]